MAILDKKFIRDLKITKAYEKGKQDANLVNQLLIGEKPGQSPGDDRTKDPYDKNWPGRGTAPRPEDRPNIPTKLANLKSFPEGGFTTTSGALIDGRNGKAYYYIDGILVPDGDFDPDKHGMIIPLAQKQLQINPQIAHAGPGQYYTEEGEVTDVSPYTFNRNTTELEVPWLKEQYKENEPEYEKKHIENYHDLKIKNVGDPLANLPYQDGRAPTRPFYNNPYPGGRPDLFIKTRDLKKDALERYIQNINMPT